jgi:hypothetical protein
MSAPFIPTRGRGAAPKQKQVLEFIKREAAFGGFPSCRRIADYMGWPCSSYARECLDRMVIAGRIKRTRIARAVSDRRSSCAYRYELPD